MNKAKPKGPVPSLIGGTNGRPARETVKQASKCSRCKGDFKKGDPCIEIPTHGGPFVKYKRYCDVCLQAILEKTYKDLEEVKAL